MPSNIIDRPASKKMSCTTGSPCCPAPAKAEQKLPFILPLLAVLASCAVLYLTYAISWTKFSRAEVFFAECAREMVATNNLITPLYQHHPFFDKPILVYWLIIVMYKTLGVSHLAARLPSIVAGLATVGLTGYLTRWLADSRKSEAGLTAAMLLGSSFMYFSFAYLCMSDVFLVLFDTITMALIYAGIVKPGRRTSLWLAAAVSMGFAFITKGPVGIVLPGAAAVAFLLATKRLSTIKWYHVIAGGTIAMLIAVPWFYAAYKANGTWALAWFFIRENLIRYAGATYDTHKPVWFMVQSLFAGFLPWSLFLPAALFGFVKDFRSARQNASSIADDSQTNRKLYLWLWLGVLTAFFSFSRGKCDYYVLPIYPAAAALCALYLTEHTRKLTRPVLATICGVVLVAGLASPVLLSILSTGGFASWWMFPVALTVFGAGGLASALSRKQLAAVTSIFCAICCGGAGFAAQVLPSISQTQSLDSYAEAMRGTPPYTQVGVHKQLGHWVDELTFQVERDPVELSDTKSIVGFFSDGPGIALIPQDVYEQALADSPELRNMPLRVLDRRMVSAHPLTPGYVLKRKGSLLDTTLLLVAN